MNEREIGLGILEGIWEIKRFRRSELEGLRTRELREPSRPEVIRTRIGLSQAAFAALMGVSVRTVQDWEQGRRHPSGAAKSLLRIAEKHPAVLLELD